MKIFTDINEIPQGWKNINIRTKSIRSNSSAIRTPKGIQESNFASLSSRLSKERDLYDAMSIALTAQSLIQKAIIISSRLRNISQEIIISGKTDPQELDIAMSEINSSLKRINEVYTSPILRAYTDMPTESIRKDEVKISLPDISSELDFFSDIASRVRSLEKNDIEKIDMVLNNLEEKSKKIDISILENERHVKYEWKNYENLVNSEVQQNLIKNTGGQIINNPEIALTVQGNLNPDSVANIFFP